MSFDDRSSTNQPETEERDGGPDAKGHLGGVGGRTREEEKYVNKIRPKVPKGPLVVTHSVGTMSKGVMELKGR